MSVKQKVKSCPGVVDYFKELLFYNKHIGKQKIKKHWFAFWTSFLWRTEYSFRGYATSYKVKLVEKKDPVTQLEASKSSIKDLVIFKIKQIILSTK